MEATSACRGLTLSRARSQRPRETPRLVGLRLALASLLSLAACGPGSTGGSDGSVEQLRDSAMTPDAAEPPCYPPYVPVAHRFTFTWHGIELLGVAFDPDGGIGLNGRFMGSADLDPGPGVELHTGDPRREYHVVARVGPDGALAWARVLDERLKITGVTVATDGTVVATGPYDNDGRATLDFDPGPGTAEQTLRLSEGGVYVLAIGRDGVFRWARRAPAEQVRSVAGNVVSRLDGTVLTFGALATARNLSWDPSAAPDAVPLPGRPYLWQLRSDGTTALVAPMPSSITRIVLAQDDSALLLGQGFLQWDADYTYGVDVQYTDAVFTLLPASYVTALAPDLSYRWTRSVDDPVAFDAVALDGQNRVYVRGFVGDELVSAPGGDIDPGTTQRWLFTGSPFVAQWDADGTYRWVNPPLAQLRGSLQSSELGVYTFGGPYTRSEIVALDDAGRWRWKLVLAREGIGGVGIDHMATSRDGELIAVAGVFSGTIDHTLGSGPPDPHTAIGTEAVGNAFVTVFTDLGGAAPRCEEQPLEEAPRFFCSPTRPITCGEIGSECGSTPDPCTSGVLDCGECNAPETCGGGGEPNRCGRAAPQVLAEGLDHPVHIVVDATHAYFTTYGDYGPLVVEPPPDGGVAGPSPVSTALRVWRVPKEGGAPAEVIYEARSRPTQLFVDTGAVYVAMAESTTSSERSLVRIPTADPAAAAPVLGLIWPIYGVEGGDVLFSGPSGVTRMPGDGSGPAAVYIPGCYPSAVMFDGGEVFYDCADGVPGYTSVRSRPRAGGAETQRSGGYPRLRLERAAADGIYFTALGAPGTRDWFRLPRVSTGTLVPERLGTRDDTEDTLVGPVVGLDGVTRYVMVAGPATADTREGRLITSPFASGAPVARLASGLNHPLNIAADEGSIWITEEGSLGMYGHSGRVLRIPR